MPKLIPTKKIVSPVISLVADEVRRAAVELVMTVSGSLTPSMMADMVKYDIGLWHSIVPPELQKAILAEAGEYASWIHLVSERALLTWVFEARSDFIKALNTAKGRYWFYRQWAMIKQELGV